MAPNLVTFIGAVFLESSVFLIMIYDTTFSATLPTWLYFYCGIALFIYQTLDAVDGMHQFASNKI
jgi:ethanolaminephosphotransferase